MYFLAYWVKSDMERCLIRLTGALRGERNNASMLVEDTAEGLTKFRADAIYLRRLTIMFCSLIEKICRPGIIESGDVIFEHQNEVTELFFLPGSPDYGRSTRLTTTTRLREETCLNIQDAFDLIAQISPTKQL